MPAVGTFIGLKEFAANQAKIQCSRKQKAFVFFSALPCGYIDSQTPLLEDTLPPGMAVASRNRPWWATGRSGKDVPGSALGSKMTKCWAEGFEVQGRKRYLFFFGIFENLKQENLRFTTQLLISCRVT